MNENHASEEQNNENDLSRIHDSEYDLSQQTKVISDEVLEHIYEDLNNLRELIEQDRETTQAMRQLISDLKSKVSRLEATLKTNVTTKGEKS